MAGYDGTIRIDSRIDTAGFNKGIAKIGGAMRSVFSKLAIAGAAVAIGFVLILAVLIKIVGWLVQLGKAMFEAGKDTYKYTKQIEELKSTFASLKLALVDAFRPLIMFALPWIQQVVSWVQALLSLIAQVIAGLTGQSGYWKTTAAAAGGAADATKEVADNTRKAGEAAEGALASFDDLNVLSMEKEKDTTTPGGGAGGAGTTQEWVGIGEKALGIIDKIKTVLASVKEFFAPLLEPLGRIWDALGRIWESVKKAAGAIWDDLSPAFEWFRDNVLLPILNTMATLFENIATWAEENPEKMKGVVAAFMLLGAVMLLVISPVAQVIAIVLLLITIIGLLIKYWPEISAAAIKAWEWIAATWKLGVKTVGDAIVMAIEGWKRVFLALYTYVRTDIIEPFKNAWNTTLNTIQNAFTRIFGSIKNTVTGIVNDIIGLINGLISGIISGINNVIDLYNKLPGKDVGLLSTPQIAPVGGSYRNVPFFASGAVIPPNAAFAAILGDQRNGMNIEAPEALIRKIVKEESGSNAVTINFAGSLGALVRELKPYIDKENNRIGRSLVRGTL